MSKTSCYILHLCQEQICLATQWAPFLGTFMSVIDIMRWAFLQTSNQTLMPPYCWCLKLHDEDQQWAHYSGGPLHGHLMWSSKSV